ncbi:MAG: LPXTG cell wall anchor domain-containing protein, partial [Eubacterium sp.]
GTATIKVKAGDKEATCTVTVKRIEPENPVKPNDPTNPENPIKPGNTLVNDKTQSFTEVKAPGANVHTGVQTRQLILLLSGTLILGVTGIVVYRRKTNK